MTKEIGVACTSPVELQGRGSGKARKADDRSRRLGELKVKTGNAQ